MSQQENDLSTRAAPVQILTSFAGFSEQKLVAEFALFLVQLLRNSNKKLSQKFSSGASTYFGST